MSKLHNFADSLAWGDSHADEPMWDATYRQLFPNLVNHMPTVGDYPSQRMGIDRIIHLSNGRVLRIDEKKREKDYGDILLETHHTKGKSPHSEKVALGWIQKDLFIDYLAYAVIPSQVVYVFDWLLLRRAFVSNKVNWWHKANSTKNKAYMLSSANNGKYHTHGLCVPISDLQKAVQNSSVVNLGTQQIGKAA